MRHKSTETNLIIIQIWSAALIIRPIPLIFIMVILWVVLLLIGIYMDYKRDISYE
jgi:hypothetical protein